MMRILIVAATQPEVEPLFAVGNAQLAVNRAENKPISPLQIASPQLPTNILITGVGMVATAFALGGHLAVNHYDLAINLGIAGSFDRGLALGEVVEITTDSLAELGAEDGEAFLPIEEMGFGESTFNAGTTWTALSKQFNITDPALQIRPVTAITVNTVHGHEPSIQQISTRLSPQVESMEGAAFFYACRKAGIPCLQIRAVSNYVEKRNRDSWQIGLAIKNLNTFAAELLKGLANN